MGLDHSKLQSTLDKSGGPGWRPREGQNRIRVLPPGTVYFTAPETIRDLALRYNLHFIRPDGKKTEAFRCYEDVGQKCPACDAWRQFKSSDDPAYEQMAQKIRRSEQFLFNIIDLNNTQAGIQVFQSNWTCYKGIMDIAANPSWGDVVSLTDGTNFMIEKVPAERSKTGYNSYTVTPERGQSNVVDILAGMDDWKARLDELEQAVDAPKEPEQMIALLEEMGFPSNRQQAAPQAPQSPSAPTAPQPPAPQAPSPPPAAPQAPTPPPAQEQTPEPEAAPAPQAPAPEPSTESTPEASAEGEVHYDPGEDYEAPLPASERPPQAPRCFSDYKPKVHQCATCPVQAECQLAWLGVDS